MDRDATHGAASERWHGWEGVTEGGLEAGPGRWCLFIGKWWSDLRDLKFTTLTVVRRVVPWREVHSRRCAAVTTVCLQNFLVLPAEPLSP